jgi:hypothetical protein
MANWKFTDDYKATFPGLRGGLLDTLVFSDHSINGTSFTGTLDFAATGHYLDFASKLLGVQTLAFSGNINVTATSFAISLTSANMPALKNLPIIGDFIRSLTLTIDNETLSNGKIPNKDDFQLNLSMQHKNVSGIFISNVPVTSGSFSIVAKFKNLGIGLSDLDFLISGGNGFGSYFPSDNSFIQSAQQQSPSLNLLEIDLGLFVSEKSNSFSYKPMSLGVTIGIVNIPIYNKSLFINPIAVSVYFFDLPSFTKSIWAISGTLALYSSQTLPPVDPPDFSFTVGMTIPIGTTPFSIHGTFDNPNSLPVSVMLKDLFGPTTTIGADADNIIITDFGFQAEAKPDGGGLSSFGINIGLASSFGFFKSQAVDLKSFTVAVNYNNS